MKRIALTIAVAFGIGANIVPISVNCTLDDSPATWQSEVKYMNNHTFYLFRCMQGHDIWVRVD